MREGIQMAEKDDTVSAAQLVRGPGNSWRKAQDEGVPRRRHPLFDDDGPSNTPPPIDELWGEPVDELPETDLAAAPVAVEPAEVLPSSTSQTKGGLARWVQTASQTPSDESLDDDHTTNSDDGDQPPAVPSESTTSTPTVVLGAEGGRVDPEALLERMTPTATVRPRQWWRRVLNLDPDRTTVHRAQVDAALQVALPRPVTVCIAQPRGEAGKTVTTIGICGAFASSRGGGVIAWDNNEGDSNMLDRLERAHQANVGDLLSTAAWFMAPESTMIELERVLQHQKTSFFKALGSDQSTNQAMTVEQFGAIHTVLRKYFPLVVIDTGNSKLAANWQAAINVADVIVVPLKLRPDHIVPAARMIRGLQDLGIQVQNRLVLVISCGPGDRHLSGPETRTLFEQHGLLQFPLLEVPTDPVIDEDPVIRWADLAEATQDAYRGLGATILAMATTQPTNEGETGV